MIAWLIEAGEQFLIDTEVCAPPGQVGGWTTPSADSIPSGPGRPMTTVLPPVKLTNARSEWGSCNHRGEIRLNWRLVQLPPDLAEYVVAHEVAHLVELNHSPRFWSQVEQLLPCYAERRRALEDWTALLAA